jgi:DNA-binding MarR family transcriptional regulator
MNPPRLFHLLHRAKKAVFARADRETNGALGVSVVELVALWHLPAADTVGALAVALGVDQAAASRLVAQLERKGLVGSEADPGDRRRRLLVRTSAGDGVARGGVGLVARANEALTHGFTPDELDIVVRFLEQATRLGVAP